MGVAHGGTTSSPWILCRCWVNCGEQGFLRQDWRNEFLEDNVAYALRLLRWGDGAVLAAGYDSDDRAKNPDAR